MQSTDQMVRERLSGRAMAGSRTYRHKALTETLTKGGSPVQAPPLTIKNATWLLALRGSIDTADAKDYANLEVRVQVGGGDLFSDGVSGGFELFSKLFGSPTQLFAYEIAPIKSPGNVTILVTYRLLSGATSGTAIPSISFDALDQP